jgi:hypothetical protein
MDMPPLSRALMRQLKANRDDEIRKEMIEHVIKQIYATTVHAACTTLRNSHHFELPVANKMVKPGQRDVYRENKGEILERLRTLFPDCGVDYVTLTRGADGQMYDVSKLETWVLPLLNRKDTKEYIMIEWT